MRIFETLLSFDAMLVDWLLHASPTTDKERTDMQRLFALRGDLDDAINDLVAFRLKLAVASLPAETASLSAATATMTVTAKTIDSVQTVLTTTGTALEIAGKALAFVVGA
jgi:hypothetical protein